MQEEIEALLRGGIIEACSGPWPSLIVPVMGQFASCVDYEVELKLRFLTPSACC